MTKAANLANLASNTNFGILNIVRGGTGLGSFPNFGVLIYEGGDSLRLQVANTTYGGTGLTSFTPDGAVYALDANTLTTGTLPVVSGGTGANVLANNSLIVGRGFDPVDTISPGAANNILVSDGTVWRANTLSQVSAALEFLGGDQEWSNVTATRAVNTEYTNETGKPITISVIAYANTANVRIASNVGSVNIANTSIANTTQTIQMIVPSGRTYMIRTTNTSVTTINSWAELRS
jgi:hypothetical protein